MTAAIDWSQGYIASVNELTLLIEMLKTRGFVFDSTRGESPIWVMGGTSVNDAGNGISIFQNAFIIEYDQTRWTIRMDAASQLVSEHVVGRIEDAAALIESRCKPSSQA